MSVKKLQKILDEIDYPVLMEIVDCIWSRMDGCGIYWNIDNNIDDLEEGDNNTYSTEDFEGEAEYDNYLVINGNNGCGETITYFFNLRKEVKF